VKKDSAQIKKKKSTVLLATIISRIVDPPVVVCVLTLFAITQSDLTRRGVFALSILLPIFVGVPLLYFLWELKTRQVKNWDITNRKERIKPLLIFLLSLLIDIIFIAVLDSSFLLNVFLLYFFWLLGFLIITLFWKISGHTSAAMLGVGVAIIWYGPSMLFLLGVIPLVAWARLVRHDHTPFQLVAGVLYSLCAVVGYAYLH
jgi:hypothetical protein